MPIQVTCPGCLARFTVSDKYSGKKGPCPKCKKEIVVPDKSQEVVIHAPEPSGPKDSKGVAVLKPIKRIEFRVGWLTWLGVAVGTLVVLGIAYSIRINAALPPVYLLVLGAIGIAPPLIMMAYTFLRDDELAGYSGKEYLVRTSICSLVFSSTWLLYYWIAIYLDNKTLADVSSIEMAALMLGMIAVGTSASLICFELETGQAVLHYAIYFAATFFLCMIMGIELAEPLAKPKVKPKVAPQMNPFPQKAIVKPNANSNLKATTPAASSPTPAPAKK